MTGINDHDMKGERSDNLISFTFDTMSMEEELYGTAMTCLNICWLFFVCLFFVCLF